MTCELFVKVKQHITIQRCDLLPKKTSVSLQQTISCKKDAVHKRKAAGSGMATKSGILVFDCKC